MVLSENKAPAYTAEASGAAGEAQEQARNILLRVHGLSKFFPVKKRSVFEKGSRFVRANDHISLDIYEGETLGLVGESGCGKSTLGRTILNLYPASEGYVIYRGRSIYDFAPRYAERLLNNFAAEAVRVQKAREEGGGKEALLACALRQLGGGLLLSDNPAEAGAALLAEYRAGVKASAKDAGAAEQAAFREASRAVEELRKKTASVPGFAEYEDCRDDGLMLECLTGEEMRSLRKELQIIFQDPYSSLDARMTISQIIGEGLVTHHMFAKNSGEMQEYIIRVMEECGLAPYFLHRYPHQFSGGQRQRVGIARSLALRPRFIVCDEAVSALDVSIQSQIINLLAELKKKENLTYLFISHNLSVVRYISDRICVMYLGHVAELAGTEQLFAHPMHPYTCGLLEAVPSPGRRPEDTVNLLEGDIPSPVNPPAGCAFHTRCRYCTEECRKSAPPVAETEPGHFVACFHPR